MKLQVATERSGILEHTVNAHAGHSHGFLGELVGHFLSLFNLSDSLQECLGHIIVDSLNVFALLIVIMFLVFLATSYVNINKFQSKLSSLKSIGGFLLAIFLGMLSPFCSCSIIPVLMGFLSMGVPVSVCLCFLTASSMINITAIVSLYATTGLSFTLIYIACSLVIIIISSIIFSMFKLDNGVSDYHHHHHDETKKLSSSFKERSKSAFFCMLNVLKRSAIFILLGVVLSSIIMTYLPLDKLSEMVNENSFLTTALVSLVGVPIHSDIFSIAPIITLFMDISYSLALTFTLTTMAISLPSIIILSRAIKLKTVLAYCGVIITLTISVGFISTLFI